MAKIVDSTRLARFWTKSKQYIDTQVGYKASKSSVTVSIAANSWSNNEVTVPVTGVTTSNDVVVSPAVASLDDYIAAGIVCTAQGSGTLTFSCEDVPSNAISVNVLIIS